MAQNTINNPEKEGNSVAAKFQKTYSAKELGEMMNTSPKLLFVIDIARHTNWYTDIDFMEEMLSAVEETERIDGFIKILLIKQEYQVSVEHHPKVCYRVTDDRKYAPYVEDLATILDAIKTRILHSRDVQRQLEEVEAQWSSTPSVIEEQCLDHHNGSNKTTQPSFNNSTDTEIPFYKLSDLPENLKDYLAIKDDKLYSEFIDILKNLIWPWMKKMRKGKGVINKWNAVKFICILRGIIRRCRDSVQDFTDFLNHIFKGEEEFNENTITQYDAANQDRNYKGYDSVPYKCEHKLRCDGLEIEKMLEPIIIAMNSEKGDK